MRGEEGRGLKDMAMGQKANPYKTAGFSLFFRLAIGLFG